MQAEEWKVRCNEHVLKTEEPDVAYIERLPGGGGGGAVGGGGA